MFTWVLVMDSIVDGEGESRVCGVYLSDESAQKAFSEYKKDEALPLVEENSWFVFDESDNEYDVGDTGDYLYNHCRLTLQKLEVEE